MVECSLIVNKIEKYSSWHHYPIFNIQTMYHCKSCFCEYDDAGLEKNKRDDVFQCDRCFDARGIVYGLYQECAICIVRNTSVIFDKCGHCICKKCQKNVTNGVCVICKSTRNVFILPHKIDQDIFYFEKVDRSIKNHFKKLHYQVKDSIGKELATLDLYVLYTEYYKFLKLLQLNDNNNNPDKLSPPLKIDAIWCEDLSVNEDYNNFCMLEYDQILFRDPVVSGDRYERTIALYKKTFNDDPTLLFWPPSRILVQKTVQLFVKTRTGKTITVNIKNGCSIYEIKEYIQNREAIPCDQMKLVFAGKYLEDDKTIVDYGIKHEFTLHLELRLRGD
uniref:Ubiquitin-like domain-containing protein n=1 Tax=viral metagenome TaxID=1070528 RepID=A0A6C0C7D2_9ZZZZ